MCIPGEWKFEFYEFAIIWKDNFVDIIVDDQGDPIERGQLFTQVGNNLLGSSSMKLVDK